MTSDKRERIKRCIAWFLCGEMGELRSGGRQRSCERQRARATRKSCRRDVCH
jgi:hypothetical protein